MNKIVYNASRVLCKQCGHEWVAIRPPWVLLKDIECPKCGARNPSAIWHDNTDEESTYYINMNPISL